jgi:hypothetical protein
MQTRTFFATDTLRALVPGAEVRVYLPGTTTAVPVFSALGVEIAQPLIADASARVDIRAWNGAVDIAFTAPGLSSLLPGVVFYDPTADPIRSFVTAADVEAATIPAPVVRIQTASRAALGDRGGAAYRRLESMPTHLARLSSNGATVWWELDQEEACPEIVGAAGDGVTDDIDALDAIADWQAATGGAIILRSFVYGISRPWEMSHEDIHVRTNNATGHNAGAEHASKRAVIQKLAGFVGADGIKVSGGSNGLYLKGIYLNGGDFVEPSGPGAYGPGNGFNISQVATVELVDCQAQNHDGFGFVIDGVWVLRTYSCVSRKNGKIDAISGAHSGGGLLYTNDIRESANHDHFGFFSTGNFGRDVLMLDGPAATDRANAIHFIGGQLESGTVEANVEIRAGTRVTFDCTGIAKGTDIFAPCVVLGGDVLGTSTVDVRFNSVYFQHNAAGPGFAVVIKKGVTRAEFVCPIFSVIRSRFINAEAAPIIGPDGLRTQIRVIGGNVPATHYRDPNRLIALTATEGVTSGMRAAGAGDSAHYGSSTWGHKLRLETLDDAGGVHFAQMGLGSGQNLLRFGDLFPSHAPQSSAPNLSGLDTGQGIVLLADGDAWDPCGVGLAKAYWCWTIDGGATFMRLGDPAA